MSNPKFSDNAKRVYFYAKVNNRITVVIDGKEGKYYEAVKPLVFGPHAQRYAYAAQKNNK